VNAEDLKEEVVWNLEARVHFENGAGKRDRSDQAANLRAGAQVMADEDDLAGPVEVEFLISLFGLRVFCVEVHLKGHISLRLLYESNLVQECSQGLKMIIKMRSLRVSWRGNASILSMLALFLTVFRPA
jgi:hypothetical protein